MTERQSTIKSTSRQLLDADQQWLLSNDSQAALGMATAELRSGTNLLKIVQRLRKSTTAQRAALVMQLAQLRIRAAKKFTNANAMYFSTKAYEQSTSERIAQYKSSCLPPGKRILDVCCGIGGDLLALADGRDTVAIDLDPVLCAYAQKNAEVYHRSHVRVLCGDAMTVPWTEFDLIHIDPDRRVDHRTTNANMFHPALPDILPKLERRLSAIKVAPATRIPKPARHLFHREWIGEDRECKQQILWRCHDDRPAGFRSASIVQRNGSVDRLEETTRHDRVEPEIGIAPGEYIFEPHAVVLASRLVNLLARAHDLRRLGPGIAYLTGTRLLSSPFLSCFRILSIESAEPRRLSAALRSHPSSTEKRNYQGGNTRL